MTTPAPRWTAGWDELAVEVIDRAVCTGCAGCVVACPQDVLDLDPGIGTPVLAASASVDGDVHRCVHAARGCTLCARVCPRFRLDRPDAAALSYQEGDPLGPHRRILLVRATDPEIAAAGQDGGLGSAILIHALDHGIIDGALVSGVEHPQRPVPRVARTRAELLACAGSRYTYSPNTVALGDADDLSRLALMSVGCQISVSAFAAARGARKLARRFALTVGLLCSKTFSDDLYAALLHAGHGIPREAITKVNIKGRLQVWHRAGYLEVPLKECHGFTRPQCTTCPDFTARHADISLGGIGARDRTTLAIVRTDLGEEIMTAMERDRSIVVEDAATGDPEAVALVRRMAERQRKRWPKMVRVVGDRRLSRPVG